MTPREKAEELFYKMINANYSFIGDIEEEPFPTAKQCALIAVDEIETTLYNECYPHFQYVDTFRFWEQVKNEIEKL